VILACLGMARTRICSFTLDRRGFVHARLDDGATLELEDAREAIEETWRVAGECRRPVLVDMTRLKGESRAARLYFVSDEAVARYSAVAILVSSPVSRVIGTFFLRLSEHKVPTRLFTSETEAMSWLAGQVE
jgi:hypothetical protein